MSGQRLAKEEHIYDLFLSYSQNPDYGLARYIEGFLESFHAMPTPNQIRLRTLSVCRDGSDFSLPKLQTLSSNGVATVRELITHELNKTKNLLVLCSEAAASSEWVRFEAEWFLANKGPDKITLAMTEGFDPSAEPERYIPDPLLKAGLGGQV